MNKLSIVPLTALLFAVSMAGCGWMGDLFDVEETPTTKVTFHGKVAVPDGPTDYVVLSATRHLAYQWYTCYQGTNDTNLSGGLFLLESANNCSSTQWVYFFSESPVDMKSFATGTIQFKLQVNNSNQQFKFVIQDSNTAIASVNLSAANGYDANKVAVDQLISVPVTTLTGADLSRITRVFQLEASCSTSDCYTTVSEIRWVPPAILSPAPFSALAGRRMPHCDPFACRGLPYGRVGIIRSSPSGWTAVPSHTTTTDSEGNYTLEVEASDLSGGGLLFVGVTDLDGTATLLSTIPSVSLKAGVDVSVDVDRTTTAVGMMVCPNGMTIPADGSGGWCIGDPISTTQLDTLGGVVDGAFNTTVSIDIEVFWDDVIDDADVLGAVNQMLAEHGIAATTLDKLDTLGANISIPMVTATTSGGTTGGTTNNDGGTVTGDKQCQGAVACDSCSITACASSTTDGSCASWYETSDGGRFNCASCGDCQAAAQQATNHCCPTP